MLTAVVLTRNEEKNITRCLQSLKFCDRILIIDDYSTDATPHMAKELGARAVKSRLNGDYASQRNFALSQVKSGLPAGRQGWVLFVDADEVVSQALVTEIKSVLNSKYSGFYISRKDSMWGKILNYGDTNIKLLRLGKGGHWTGKVHETWQVTGSVGALKNPLYHHPHPTYIEFLQHINHYSTLRAEELKGQNYKTNIFEIIFYPIGKFLNLWIWKLGFADGTVGFIHAMTMAFYSFLVRGKLWLNFF